MPQPPYSRMGCYMRAAEFQQYQGSQLKQVFVGEFGFHHGGKWFRPTSVFQRQSDFLEPFLQGSGHVVFPPTTVFYPRRLHGKSVEFPNHL
jgi:hypothetical protein